MLYNSEEAFIDKFIACLKLKNITTIPFDNDSFYAGAERMSQCFQTNKENFGEDASEISLLFIRNSLEGTFTRFRDAISEQNGWYISFENPEYVKGILKISENDAMRILSEEDISIEKQWMEELATAFCEGANLQIK
ncbi:MAG: hypothetical protein II992_13335 [Lachnospiraceae bacterium]|nr:hypothetical protein [Lachnospiraceae bacterium]MBQ3602157.1 hypothetical protein [Lachnospiraceae bacterium]